MGTKHRLLNVRIQEVKNGPWMPLQVGIDIKAYLEAPNRDKYIKECASRHVLSDNFSVDYNYTTAEAEDDLKQQD